MILADANNKHNRKTDSKISSTANGRYTGLVGKVLVLFERFWLGWGGGVTLLGPYCVL